MGAFAAFLDGRRGAAGAGARVKAWAAARFDGEETVCVSEAVCVTPGCPPLQTVIALLHPCGAVTLRLPKRLVDVTPEDVAALDAGPGAWRADVCC